MIQFDGSRERILDGKLKILILKILPRTQIKNPRGSILKKKLYKMMKTS